MSPRCGTLTGMYWLIDPRVTLVAVGATCAIILVAGAAWMVDPPVDGPLRWAVWVVAVYWAARTARLHLSRAFVMKRGEGL